MHDTIVQPLFENQARSKSVKQTQFPARANLTEQTQFPSLDLGKQTQSNPTQNRVLSLETRKCRTVSHAQVAKRTQSRARDEARVATRRINESALLRRTRDVD